MDWLWEGNVVAAISRHLEIEDWLIVSAADTLSRQRGVDIHATRDNRTLLIEVKGYPSKKYRDPRRAHEVKPTNPRTQAQHWFSQALLQIIRLQSKHPLALVALGIPDMQRYRTLFDETQPGLRKIGAAVIFVRENGTVETWGLDEMKRG